MKHYYKEVKTTKQVNIYLKKINLEGWEFDVDYNFPEEFDFDGWIDADETNGLSIQVEKTNGTIEIRVTKYTKQDIEKMEAEISG
jgi:hypothetical protein